MFGRTLLSNHAIKPTRVSADGSPEYKAGGVTLDWSTVTATGTNTTTLPDGSTILPSTKYLRYGQEIAKITASGKFGPYDPGASDGRQTLARGDCFIVDQTVLQYGAGGIAQLGVVNDQIGGVFDGGDVYIDRVMNSGTNTHTLALGPTLAEVGTAFPRLKYTRN